LLKEYEGICISYSTVYRILSQAGLTSPKKHRKKKFHHRRKRKPQEGMLVQIDASPFPWIIGGKLFSLHGAIDDATGKILALFFAKNECLEGYFQIIRQIINLYGISMSIYCDCHTIFLSPNDGKLTIDEQLQGKQVNLTQFGKAMSELGISVIKAKTPQAKILYLPLGLLIPVLHLIMSYALRKNVLLLKMVLFLTRESIISL
jgi:hypothetical protein